MRSIVFIAATLTMINLPIRNAQTETPQKFDIRISGDAFFAAAVVTQDHEINARNVDFMNRFRLRISPIATADNGLTYGARLRIRASQPNVIIDADQGYIFVQGNFGLIEMGLTFNPAMQYNIVAPSNFGTGGVDGDWAIGQTGWFQNQLTFLEPSFGGGFTPVTFLKYATKVNYISPRFFSLTDSQHGLLATASYTPVNRSLFTGVAREQVDTNPAYDPPFGYKRTIAYSNCGSMTPIACNYFDVHEFVLRYDETIHDIDVKASLAHIGGTTGTVNFGILQKFYDLSAWQTGLQLGMYGVLVGGSVLDAGKSAYPRQSLATGRLYMEDQYSWSSGISYERGPWAVGFNYLHGHDAGDLTAPGARTADLYATGLTYTLAPGLTTALEYLRSTTVNESNFVRDSYGFNRAHSGDASLYLWKTQVTF